MDYATGAVTRDDMIDRARALVPALRERAAEAEQNRRLPDETHRDFIDAGLYRLFQPRRHGGFEMEFDALIDIAAELGRGCGSSAWIFTNLAGQNWINGMKDARAQDEVWGGAGETVISSSYQGRDASVAAVEGGVVVSGTWNFSSGVDFAAWNNMQVFIPRRDRPPEHRFALVPRSDYEIVDDWHTNGLAATGSKSLTVTDVFIPDYRTLRSADAVGGPTPGSAVNPGALYRLPLFAVGNKVFSAPALGIALGALEAVEDDIAARVSVGGAALKEQPTVQLRIGEAAAEIEAARALLERDCAECIRVIGEERLPTIEQRARWRRNNAYAGKLCVQAVERLYSLAGAHGLSFTSPFQRAWRDVHAATSQVALSWDIQGVNYGRQRLGLEISDPRAFPDR